MERLQGARIDAKISSFGKLEWNQVLSIVEAGHGFVAQLLPGHLLTVLAGMICLQIAPNDTDILRWSLCSLRDMLHVKKALEAMLQSYEQLNTTDYLVVHRTVESQLVDLDAD